MSVNQIVSELKKVSSKERAKISKRFFKTGKGEYGEGDIFIGVTVPDQRKIAKRFFAPLSFVEIQKLLESKIHEHRFTALLILCLKFEKTKTVSERKKIVDFYLNNIIHVNNWDLVDTSAYIILGGWFVGKKDRGVLYKLAKSKNIWARRIAIVSTYTLIKQSDFKDIFILTEKLLKDDHDLIQKALGWMLREVGKKSRNDLNVFLKKNYKKMPRVMLRYAIERFSKDERLKYLKGEL